MKKILIAPDSFKGSLSAKDVCEIAKKAILGIDPSALVDEFPMADGGEGTVEAIVYNRDGYMRTCQVEGPLGQPVEASYGIVDHGKTAVMEMAEASGITLIEPHQLNPMETSTYGVGQLIRDALDQGCNKLLLGIGGSATNDGGMGMLSALGFQFLDANGQILTGKGSNLAYIASVDLSKVAEEVKSLEIEVACDVDNPLIGPKGATYIYGPQKGADDKMLKVLEEGMINYATVIEKTIGINIANYKGAGAAGGLGAGLVAFLGATLESGFQMVSQAVGLQEKVATGNYDLIITGEGQINHQTLHGKLPHGVATIGKGYGVPVIGIVGSIGTGYEPILEQGMTSVFSILNSPMSLEEAMENAGPLLEDTVKRVYHLFIN